MQGSRKKLSSLWIRATRLRALILRRSCGCRNRGPTSFGAGRNACLIYTWDNRPDRRECLAVKSNAQAVDVHVCIELDGSAFAVHFRKITTQQDRKSTRLN